MIILFIIAYQIVESFSRYCDMCGLTAKLETDLNDKGHLFLPEVARGTEEKFAPICNRIVSNIYTFNRTINLPGRRELEVLINEKVEGLDGEIRQRLNKKVRCLCLLNISKKVYSLQINMRTETVECVTDLCRLILKFSTTFKDLIEE